LPRGPLSLGGTLSRRHSRVTSACNRDKKQPRVGRGARAQSAPGGDR